MSNIRHTPLAVRFFYCITFTIILREVVWFLGTIIEFFKKHKLDDLAKNWKFELDFGEERWTAPNEELHDADKITLKQTTTREGWELNFNYDYGDDWNVKFVLEKCEKKAYNNYISF